MSSHLWTPARLIVAGCSLVSLAAVRPSPAGAQAPTAEVKLGGEVQTRYVAVRRGAGADSVDAGFQIRRARLIVSGWFLDPRLTFRVRPSYDRATGNLQFDDAWVAYGRDDGLKVKVGQYKPDVLREEIIPNFSELAVEASYASTYFGLDYTQALQLTWGGAHLRPSLLLHDGAYGANTDFNADRTTVALAGRLELLAAGEWRSFAGSSGFSSVTHGVLLGAAADYERGQRAPSRASPDVVKVTADVSAVWPGASLLAALYLQHFTMTWGGAGAAPTRLDGADQLGVVAQAGWFLVRDRLELLGRYEWMDFGGVYYRNAAGAVQAGSRNLSASHLRIATAGVNWYLRGEAAKLSVDLQLTGDPVPVDNTSVGLLRFDRGNEVALRTQFQWRF
jgi:hypothetical protein